MNVAVLELAQVNQAQIVLGLFSALGLGNALHLHAELDVLSHREPGEQAMFLKDQNAIGARTLNRVAIDQNLSRSLGVQASDQCSSVDLPQPDGPTMQKNSPGVTCRLMLSSASRRSPLCVR